mmetsp:Transcript_20508/g.32027  ORF Transcript_20508/g.32027 Transcript_20508/m.32027 type:complete len:187 (-) Transcript_20508:34-594(-)|eukprot:CAMPEP_0201523140 /NCGR_PEP_ID=MMETSP0161_2-20130828/18766_1 /ASSEMBLY_ACC=CAM_ASM_000251 /TAXON_ID=180227 /ORGANISM="Neoparamoeba aestuarina, Strain SoJaBio B1-5/56/2" /LENGTH=186 /DNA_ID=CAMNT_0047922145 /DNA_START=77 /DNA_END=637 /DNA_ORIENTATION=+
MSAFSEIMSQQLAEELDKQYHLDELHFQQEFEVEGGEELSPSDSNSCLSEDMVEDEDEKMARQMQQAFDAEFAFHLAKNPASLEMEGREMEEEEQDDSEGDDELDVDFDNFGVPIYLSNRDENGQIITKHNPVLCGMKNANKVALYVDGAGDMDGTLLNNSVYNSLRQKSLQNEKKEKHSVRKTTC